MPEEIIKWKCSICGKEFDSEESALDCEKAGKGQIVPIGTIFHRFDGYSIVKKCESKKHKTDIRYITIGGHIDSYSKLEEPLGERESLKDDVLPSDDFLYAVNFARRLGYTSYYWDGGRVVEYMGMFDFDGIKFIKMLNACLYGGHDMYSDVYGKGWAPCYSGIKIEPDELEKLLNIIQEEKLIFFPINTSMGFAVGFVVAEGKGSPAPGVKPEYEIILQFREAQLPAGFGWNTLAEVFNSPENLDRLRYYGIDKPKNYSHYTY